MSWLKKEQAMATIYECDETIIKEIKGFVEKDIADMVLRWHLTKKWCRGFLEFPVQIWSERTDGGDNYIVKERLIDIAFLNKERTLFRGFELKIKDIKGVIAQCEEVRGYFNELYFVMPTEFLEKNLKKHESKVKQLGLGVLGVKLKEQSWKGEYKNRKTERSIEIKNFYKPKKLERRHDHKEVFERVPNYQKNGNWLHCYTKETVWCG